MKTRRKHHTFFRGRFAGLLYFGKDPKDQYCISDPCNEKLDDALYTMRYGIPTKEQVYLVMHAAEAYQHLFRYPIRTFAKQQFLDICRSVKIPSKDGWKPNE